MNNLKFHKTVKIQNFFRFKGEVLLRFCPEPYHPFDPTNIEKYVVYETQKTVFEMPSLKDMVSTLNISFKSAFEAHLRSQGYSTNDLWGQIDDAIVTLILENENILIEKTKDFGKPESFFELVRFDFVIDEDFVVHLMEVNMSPNLTPSADKFEGYALGYEQVTYTALHCVMGIDNKLK
jgi:tubulin monoglycylase TTLL15